MRARLASCRPPWLYLAEQTVWPPASNAERGLTLQVADDDGRGDGGLRVPL